MKYSNVDFRVSKKTLTMDTLTTVRKMNDDMKISYREVVNLKQGLKREFHEIFVSWFFIKQFLLSL